MIHIQYDDYLKLIDNLQKLRNKEEVEKSLDTLDSLIHKIRKDNANLNDGRD